MTIGKQIWKWFKIVQNKIDLTPHLIRYSEKFAGNRKASIFMFILFLMAGLFGLFLPLIQGWLTLFMSLNFLGIKPLNRFIRSNKASIMNIGTLVFTITFGLILINTGMWATGYTETSPFENIIGVIQWGQDDLESANTQAFSLISVDYGKMQQALSLVDYSNTQGFSIIRG